ncbi:MAG: septum site-determining protein MinC [Neisseria sp.]|nr:septum site-determining protein MinC [Neisseria sp.]
MSAVFTVKSARVDVLSILPESDDPAVLKPALEEYFSRFDDIRSMPFLLDVHRLHDPWALRLDEVLAMFKALQLNVIGVRHVDKSYAALAAKHGLAFSPLPEGNVNVPQPEMASAAETPAPKPTVVIDKPVRSGQQIYAEGADLICTALVSQGAEVIADGNIHVYAPLRGRALAGAAGNAAARIFVQNMQAQLVSIAGIYRTFERQLPDALNNKAVCVTLQEDKLNISAL